MYQVTVKSKGKHNNTVLGSRYCFTRRSAIDLITTFIKGESDFCVEKLIRVHGDIFCWSSNTDALNKIWDKLPPEAVDFWR